MTGFALVPVVASLLLVVGAAISLIGAFGLLRLGSFFERTHAPTLGTTLGVACTSFASMLHFTSLGTRPIVHELLIVLFVTFTTPITLMILVRAALLRAGTQAPRNAAKDEANPV